MFRGSMGLIGLQGARCASRAAAARHLAANSGSGFQSWLEVTI